MITSVEQILQKSKFITLENTEGPPLSLPHPLVGKATSVPATSELISAGVGLFTLIYELWV